MGGARMFDPRAKAMTDPVHRAVRQPLGHVSIEPSPSPEALAAYYAERYYQSPSSASYAVEYDDREIAHKRLRARLWLSVIADLTDGGQGAGFLEVGCGEGFLLAAAAAAGWSVTGLDFTDSGLRRWHPELADRVAVGDAYSLLGRAVAEARRFRVVALQNVLEHVVDPGRLLRDVAGVVEPGGVVVVQVPNDFSRLQARALELGHIGREFWVAPPDHLTYFNTETGPAFAAANGYDLLDMFADFPIDWFLFHPGSAYVDRDPAAGKAAHAARIDLDLLLAERGIEPYRAFYRALARCGGGRNIAMVLRPRA